MKNLISNLLKNMGYTLTKTSNLHKAEVKKVRVIDDYESLLTIFYKNLQSSGFQPNFIMDIGSNIGGWTRNFLNYFPNTNVLMVDPQERLKPSFEDLLNDKIQYLAAGVGDQDGTLKFTIHERDDSCSFIYSEEEAKELGLEQIEVPIKTINSIIKENSLPIPDLVKIDAEGLDLEVLDGASDIMGKTEIILVEATVTSNVYKNTMAAVVKKMDENGYQVYEVTDLNRPFPEKPILWLIELVFVKKDSFLLQHNLSV